MVITILRIAAAVIILGVLTHLGLWYAADIKGIEMSIHGHIAMAVGIFFTYGVGAGLMALLFFSNKHGHDQLVSDSVEIKSKQGD